MKVMTAAAVREAKRLLDRRDALVGGLRTLRLRDGVHIHIGDMLLTPSDAVVKAAEAQIVAKIADVDVSLICLGVHELEAFA